MNAIKIVWTVAMLINMGLFALSDANTAQALMMLGLAATQGAFHKGGDR